jgi:hypothetical protein
VNFFDALYPQTMLVNLLLGLTCLFWSYRIILSQGKQKIGISLFFVFSGLSLIAGGFYHGFYLVPTNETASSLWFFSHVFSIFSVSFLQWGSMDIWCKNEQQRKNFMILVMGQFVIMLTYRILVPSFLLVAISFGLATLHLILVTYKASQEAIKGSKWLLTGLSFVMLSGVVFLFKDKTEETLYLLNLSHAILGIGFYQMFLGVKVLPNAFPKDAFLPIGNS